MGVEKIECRDCLARSFNNEGFRSTVRRLLVSPDAARDIVNDGNKLRFDDEQDSVMWDLWINWLKDQKTSHLFILSGII
jgi:hypothetical protein